MLFSVTASIFYKKLEEFCNLKPHHNFHDKYIENTQVWNNEDTPIENYMYLISCDDLIKNHSSFKNCFLICMGEFSTEKYKLSPSCDLIICQDLENMYSLCNIIFSIHNQFRKWKNQINNILLTSENFEEIFEASYNLLKMKFLLIDSEYNCISHSKNFFEADNLSYKPTKNNISDFINELRLDDNNEFIDNFETHDAYKTSLQFDQNIILMYNIFFHNNRIATLIAKSPFKTYYEGDIQLFQHLGDILTEYYDKYYTSMRKDTNKTRLVDLFCSLAKNDLGNADSVSYILTLNGWMIYHTYQIVKLVFMKQNEIGFSREYFCSQIEKNFKSSIAFVLDNEIFFVRNISLLNNEDDFTQKLPYFLRDNLCKAGISNKCNNFLNLHKYFVQTRTALIIGEQKESMFWYYRFSDFAFDYLLIQCIKDYSPWQVAHKALRTLKKYDSENHTDYFNTLKFYLEEKMNASRTASRLFIHRSTFLHRVEQIQKLTEINMNNYEECTYLQLSYIILDRQNDENSTLA